MHVQFTCNVPSIDVRVLYRQGLLEPGPERPLYLQHPEGLQELMWCQVCDNRLELSYSSDVRDINTFEVGEEIRLVSTPCNFGGHRSWFECPVEECEKPVAILYKMDGRFACRRCCRLLYVSQWQGPQERTIKRAQKIRERLGGDENLTTTFPLKPPRMHYTTYHRLRCLEKQLTHWAWSSVVEKLATRRRDTFLVDVAGDEPFRLNIPFIKGRTSKRSTTTL